MVAGNWHRRHQWHTFAMTRRRYQKETGETRQTRPNAGSVEGTNDGEGTADTLMVVALPRTPPPVVAPLAPYCGTSATQHHSSTYGVPSTLQPRASLAPLASTDACTTAPHSTAVRRPAFAQASLRAGSQLSNAVPLLLSSVTHPPAIGSCSHLLVLRWPRQNPSPNTPDSAPPSHRDLERLPRFTLGVLHPLSACATPGSSLPNQHVGLSNYNSVNSEGPKTNIRLAPA